MSALAGYEWPLRIVTVCEELCTTGICVIRHDEVHMTRHWQGVRLHGEFGLESWLASRRPAGVLPVEEEEEVSHEGTKARREEGNGTEVSHEGTKARREENGTNGTDGTNGKEDRI